MQVLQLEANRISSISSTAQATHLPISLEMLSLARNQLPRIQELTFLTSLENLHELDIDSNPFVETAKHYQYARVSVFTHDSSLTFSLETRPPLTPSPTSMLFNSSLLHMDVALHRFPCSFLV